MDRYEKNDKMMRIVEMVKTEFPEGCDGDCCGYVLDRHNDKHYEGVCSMLDVLQC